MATHLPTNCLALKNNALHTWGIDFRQHPSGGLLRKRDQWREHEGSEQCEGVFHFEMAYGNHHSPHFFGAGGSCLIHARLKA
jgi:hypothetical protein